MNTFLKEDMAEAVAKQRFMREEILVLGSAFVKWQRCNTSVKKRIELERKVKTKG